MRREEDIDVDPERCHCAITSGTVYLSILSTRSIPQVSYKCLWSLCGVDEQRADQIEQMARAARALLRAGLGRKRLLRRHSVSLPSIKRLEGKPGLLGAQATDHRMLSGSALESRRRRSSSAENGGDAGRAAAEGRAVTISAAQIREARRLLDRKSPWLSKVSGIEFVVVLKAQHDDESASVDPAAVHAIEQALVRAGVEFTVDGVRLRKVAAPE